MLVNHNGAACLGRTLEELARNTVTDDVECIVVDSGSADGSWEGVEQVWPRARVLRFEENVGFCVGCNRGAEEGSGRLLAFVNFDGQVEPGWDMPLAGLLDDPTVSISTGLLLSSDGAVIQAAGLSIAPNTAVVGRLDMLPREMAPGEPIDVPAATGALMMVRRQEFLDLGGFYEPFFMYGEEADYCLRVPGRVVLTPASAIRHEYGHAAGPRFSPLRRYLLSRNRLVNASRNLPDAALAKAVLSSAAFDAATLARSPSAPALRAVLRGWRDGLAVMPRERRTGDGAERRAAAKRLVSFREAYAQHRRLPS